MKKKLWTRILSTCLCMILLVSSVSGLGASAQQETAIVTATESNRTLKQTAETIRLEIEKMPTTGALRNGRIRLTGFSPSADGSNEVKELHGKHFLVRGEGSNHYIILRMSANVLPDPDTAGNYGPYVKTTNTYGAYPWSGESYEIYHPLQYNPEKAEVIQLRFKPENCTNTDKKTSVTVLPCPHGLQ